MAAAKTLSHPFQTYNSIVPQHGVVTLFGYGINARVDRGHLVLEDGIGPERRQARLPRVNHGLKRLVVIGSDGLVSLSALRWLADQRASFVMLERNGSVLATTGPVHSFDVRLRRAQALAVVNGTDLRISKELISQKLAAQQHVTSHRLKNDAMAEEICRCSAELAEAPTIDAIRCLEARAASSYWFAWRNVSIEYPKNDLPRLPQHWKTFGSRVSPLTGKTRLAVNPANAILNYLYALLEAEASLAAAALGLDPGLGLMHADQKARNNLACDLMEPVRPKVDAFLLDLLESRMLNRTWFFEERNGNCRLMAELTAKLSETLPTWRRAVAPFAEWTAQTLWKDSHRKSSREYQLPTRLTQQRKKEACGKTFQPSKAQTPKPERICERCGGPVGENKHCADCGKQLATEGLIEGAKLGRQMSKTPAAIARVSTSQMAQRQAIATWSAESLPPWLTLDFYFKEIQPKLRAVTVSRTAAELGVSRTYVSQLRARTKKPHPRHWSKLAELVGISQ